MNRNGADLSTTLPVNFMIAEPSGNTSALYLETLMRFAPSAQENNISIDFVDLFPKKKHMLVRLTF
jgi:hypothetical protein